MKKPVIANVARPEGWKDDAAKAAAKAISKRAEKELAKQKKIVQETGRRAISRAKKDVADPKYRGKIYDDKGGLTKEYKDYVMRNMRGNY